MKYESLDGYSIVHTSKKGEGILREKRLVLRLTQQEVADKANIKVQQYQKFESGERNIYTASFQLACRVIEALDMDITKFYHRDYVIGEPLIEKDGELCYAKTGKSINEEI